MTTLPKHAARPSTLLLLVTLCASSACAARGPMPAAPQTVSLPLSQHFSAPVAAALDQALRPGCVWTTDADGTLWSDDIGEGFLHQLIADRALVSPEAQGVDVWRSYEERVAKDKAEGYAWAVQVMAGMPEAEVRERAERYARSFVAAHLFPGMRALLDEAQARGCTPWIVSASNWWVVQAAAPLLGLPVEHAVGIRVAVADGRLTTTVLPPVTFREGKVEAVRQFIGQPVALATGDSSGDIELLAHAGLGLFIEHPGKTAPELLTLAREKGWQVQSFAMR